jgi:hypothetical protein
MGVQKTIEDSSSINHGDHILRVENAESKLSYENEESQYVEVI